MPQEAAFFYPVSEISGLEVDYEWLRFTESEIREWLGSLAEVAPPDAWFTRMYERTEGWPIALNLVR